MLHEDVDFKTLSDRYTKSRMLTFLTHIEVIRANVFLINPRQKMIPTTVNRQLIFFTVKLDPINSFASITADVRQIYLKLTVVVS